jgi:DNA processing protein
VLGSGVDVAYPPENASLFASIAERGAVVSEFPLGTPPNKENFPRRNRVVSGMSRGVLVVEADERSGALITARLAGEDHGRTVFALPGRVDNPLSAGPHLLIRDGATLVTKLDEILEGLDPLPRDDATQAAPFPEPSDGVDKALVANTDSELVGARPTSRTPATPAREDTRAAAAPADLGLSERQLLILSGIGNDSANVDAIMERTALPAHVVLQELTLLSLKGQLRRVDGQTYARRQR